MHRKSINSSPKAFVSYPLNKLNKWNIATIVLALFMSLTFLLLFFLYPSFLGDDHRSFLQVIIDVFKDTNKDIGKKSIMAFFCFLCIVELPLMFIMHCVLWKFILIYISFKKWYPCLLNKQAEIINSCVDSKKWKDRVAMFVPVCNDFLPNTILQTAKQTYANMDVWISDDSSKYEVQKAVDAFCKKHHFHLIRRDAKHKQDHPNKIGSIYYFFEKYGDKYDYIFENDSSSIITPNFVYNALCYFKSPLIDNSKISAVIANGSFYGCKNIIGYLQSKNQQFGETFITGSALALISNTAFLNGWCCMYKASTLKEMSLSEVECTICDAARGVWLAKHNKFLYVDRYSFAAKLSPQTITGFKKQKLKWHSGDIFVYSNCIGHGKFENINSYVPIKIFYLFIVRIWPIYYFLTIFKMIFTYFVFKIDNNLILINLSASLVTSLFCGFVFIVVVIAVLCFKQTFKMLLYSILCGMLEYSIYHQRIFFIIYHIFFGKKSKKWKRLALTNITRKTTKLDEFNFRNFLLDCGIILFVIFLTTAVLGILVYLCLINNETKVVYLIMSLYLYINGPLFVYILLYFATWIKTKVGYDESFKEYHFEKYDFRYEMVSKTELWKKQNPTKVV